MAPQDAVSSTPAPLAPAERDANPLLAPFDGPFGLPPFERIEDGHFAPAYEAALAAHRAEIEAIATNPEPPSFANTIEALERAGATLSRVGGVFWNLTGADSNEARRAVERDVAPKLSAHFSAISMDPRLFARVEALWARRDELGLDDEQARVLLLTRRGFVRQGARLDDAGKARLAAILNRLSELGVAFSQNVLADEAEWLLVLEGEDDLAGLPESLRAAMARVATDRGHPAKHAVTLSRSILEPFLQESTRADLRARVQAAFAARGANGDAHDNRAIIRETVALRAERARLLGFDSFAAFKHDAAMARTPAAVRELLDRVWEAGRSKALAERADLEARARMEGWNAAITPADWRHYAEKVRRERHDFDEAQLKPYLALDAMIAAAFDVATRLFGLRFAERTDLPRYHPDVRAWEVTDRHGAHVGLFLGDYFARPSKRSGAWMSAFRSQDGLTGERPIIVNVMNFAKSERGPPLLSFDDARTLFHEFGHALHGLLSRTTYPSIAGTSVERDFVELPSQLYEHWLSTPEVLNRFARHHETGEPMPAALVEKLLAARNFNQGFATVEYTSSALVDLDLHELREAEIGETWSSDSFEAGVLERIALPDGMAMRHRTPHFTHVFSGDGYSAGYYSYLWSEVLDADAFDAFKEAGDVFDPAVAERLETFVYAAGSRRDPSEAYVAFRGRLPSVEPLLLKRGLV